MAEIKINQRVRIILIVAVLVFLAFLWVRACSPSTPSRAPDKPQEAAQLGLVGEEEEEHGKDLQGVVVEGRTFVVD